MSTKYKVGQRVRVEYTGVIMDVGARSVTLKTDDGFYYGTLQRDIKEVLPEPMKVGDKFQLKRSKATYEILHIIGDKCWFKDRKNDGILNVDHFLNADIYTRVSE